MENILIYSDCLGNKQTAISGVFTRNQHVPPIIHHRSSHCTEVPFSLDDFEQIAQKRIDAMSVGLAEDQYDFLITIQRGFFKNNSRWHVVGYAYLQNHDGETVCAFTSSVPLSKDVSEQMDINPELRYESLQKEYPTWNKKDLPLYELITGEKETDWFKEALRNCIRITKKIPA